MNPFLLVLSAPSGGGKSTIAQRLLQGRDDIGYSVSATTRPRRANEVDGRDYHFLGREEFQRRVAAGEFVEWAEYGGELYGTLKSELAKVFAEGHHAVLDIEIEGARQVKQQYPDSVRVFILPPTGSALIERLAGRNTEPPRKVRARVERAGAELAAAGEYDYIVVNDDLVTAVERVAAIIDAESQRVRRQKDLAGAIARLRNEVAQAARDIR